MLGSVGIFELVKSVDIVASLAMFILWRAGYDVFKGRGFVGQDGVLGEDG